MKTRIMYLSLFICSISAFTYSQTTEMSSASAAMKDSVLNVFSAWNGDRIVTPVTFGTETSGFFYFREYPWIETYGLSLAIYRGQPFSFYNTNKNIIEKSPLYHTYNEKLTDYRYSDTFIFFDPGISVYSINRKYSIGLYKRIETQIYDNGQQMLAPVKVNFHF